MNDGMPTINTRLVSSVQKREVMWNIIEPGDAYDIRKSMIAKLPGRETSMGDHLELVCLLQAAEIERLCEFLEEYKLKFREVERRDLDRHSYEVQIKELSQRIGEGRDLREENTKLRQFLRKQTTEFEELKKRSVQSSYEGEVVRKYEEALRQVETLRQENEFLKGSLGKAREEQARGGAEKEAFYKLEIQFKKVEFENRRLKEQGEDRNREVEELQTRCKQLVYQLEEAEGQLKMQGGMALAVKEYENRFTMLGQEIERLNLVLREKSGEFSQVSSRCRQLEDDNRRKQSQLSDLQAHKSSLENNVRLLQRKVTESTTNLEVLNESRMKFQAYEGNLERLSLEIERLNGVLRGKVSELDEANRRVSELEFEVRKGEGTRREVDEFRSKYAEFNGKMVEYENRVALLSQEIERLKQTLQRREDEVGTLESQLKYKNSELASAQQRLYEAEVEYRGKVTELEIVLRERGGEHRLQSELDHVSAVLKSRNEELERLQGERRREGSLSLESQRVTQQLQSELSVKEMEVGRMEGKLKEYQERIVGLSREIERLNGLLNRNSPSKNEAVLENRVAILNQEIERLTETLQMKEAKMRSIEGELESWRRRGEDSESIRQRESLGRQQEIDRLREELRVTTQRYETVTSQHRSSSHTSKEYEGRLRVAQEENSQLGRKVSESEYHLSTLSRQIERLNEVLKGRVNDNSLLQERLRKSNLEMEELRHRMPQYENKVVVLSQEVERLNRAGQQTQQQEGEYRRRISELEHAVGEYESRLRERDGQARSSGQEVEYLQRTISEVTRRANEGDEKMGLLSREIERLNDLLEKYHKENDELRNRLRESESGRSRASQELEIKIRQITLECESYSKRCQEQESKLAFMGQELERVSGTARNKGEEAASYEARLRSAQDEQDSLVRKLNEANAANRSLASDYESKMMLLSNEIERLNGLLKAKVEEVRVLETRVRQTEQESSSYQRRISEIEHGTVREYQSKVQFVSRENEELKSRVKELTASASRIGDYENRLTQTMGEIERLNKHISLKNEESQALQQRVRNLEEEAERYRRRNEETELTMNRELKNQAAILDQKISAISQENEEVRRNLREHTELSRKIPEYEGKIGLLSNEIKRLNEVLAKYHDETVPGLEEKVRRLSHEGEDYRRRAGELGEVDKNYQELLGRFRIVSQDLEQKERQVVEYETRMSHISGEVERLNNVLRSKVEEAGSWELRYREITSEQQVLTRRLNDASDVNRKIPEMESRVALLSQEIERLNGALRAKAEEASSWEGKTHRYEHEFESQQRKIGDMEGLLAEQKSNRGLLEQKLSSQAAENDELRRNLRELSDVNRRMVEYESRMALLSQEIERLNGALRSKVDELSSAETRFANYKRESEAQLMSVNGQLQQQRRRANEAVSSHSGRAKEYETRIYSLQEEVEKYGYTLKEARYELETERNKQGQYVQEIERLNNTLRLKVEESQRWEQAHGELRGRLQTVEESYGVSSSEFQKLKTAHQQLMEEHGKANKHLVEYEQSINKLYMEFERLQAVMQEQKQENYQLKVQLQEAAGLTEKNRHLSAEIERLRKVNQQQASDLEELRLSWADQGALQKRVSEDMALMVVLFAEIESLRKRVKETEIEIEDVRRESLAPFQV